MADADLLLSLDPRLPGARFGSRPWRPDFPSTGRLAGSSLPPLLLRRAPTSLTHPRPRSTPLSGPWREGERPPPWMREKALGLDGTGQRILCTRSALFYRVNRARRDRGSWNTDADGEQGIPSFRLSHEVDVQTSKSAVEGVPTSSPCATLAILLLTMSPQQFSFTQDHHHKSTIYTAMLSVECSRCYMIITLTHEWLVNWSKHATASDGQLPGWALNAHGPICTCYNFQSFSSSSINHGGESIVGKAKEFKQEQWLLPALLTVRCHRAGLRPNTMTVILVLQS